MTFPVYLRAGPVTLHPHWVFEALAYAVGFRAYLRLRARQGDHLDTDRRWWIVVAAIVGAAAGGKILFWLSDPALTLSRWRDPYYLMGGKTIVGGLIGGLLAVEWTKRRLGIVAATGDLFALPLTLGIAIGRIGCFLTGLSDHTFGLPTRLPWGVDFGDGIPRHPTQLYEVAWLGLVALWLRWLSRRPHQRGDLFKYFMVAYMSFRLAIEWIKPGVALAGLTTIQWACLSTLAYYRRALPRLCGTTEATAHG